MAGILGASLAPYAATWLASSYGLPFVGYYLSATALISLVALSLTRETRHLAYGTDGQQTPQSEPMAKG